MTGPKKPRSASAMPAAPAALTAAQLRVAKLFGLMSGEAQAGMLPMMEAMAQELPRRVRPSLHLVGRGAK